jgi:hypothetical protein
LDGISIFQTFKHLQCQQLKKDLKLTKAKKERNVQNEEEEIKIKNYGNL